MAAAAPHNPHKQNSRKRRLRSPPFTLRADGTELLKVNPTGREENRTDSAGLLTSSAAAAAAERAGVGQTERSKPRPHPKLRGASEAEVAKGIRAQPMEVHGLADGVVDATLVAQARELLAKQTSQPEVCCCTLGLN